MYCNRKALYTYSFFWESKTTEHQPLGLTRVNLARMSVSGGLVNICCLKSVRKVISYRIPWNNFVNARTYTTYLPTYVHDID